MASPQDALEYAMRMVGNMPLDDPKLIYRLLDDAHKKLWMAALWHWSVGYFEEFTVQNDQQDYTFAGSYNAIHVINGSLTNGQEKYELTPSGALPVTTSIVGRPGQVQLLNNGLRIFPAPSGYPSSNLPKLLATYKKTPTTIAAGNANDDYTTLSVPDEWFWVYQEIVLLKAYQFSNSPRLGAVETMPQGIRYTGQFGAVEAALAFMKQAEEKLFDTIGKVVQ